jgi:hypothetical protein
MELIRWGQSHRRQSQDSLYYYEDAALQKKTVRARYKKFGRGSERKSWFSVSLEWEDVETIIRRFVEMKHPEALRLQSALRLAAAAQEAGWSPESSPQSN